MGSAYPGGTQDEKPLPYDENMHTFQVDLPETPHTSSPNHSENPHTQISPSDTHTRAAPSGSFAFDLTHQYRLCWDSMEQFMHWLSAEQKQHCIEYTRHEIVKNSETGDRKRWIERHRYLCARHGRTGKSQYTKTRPDRESKANIKAMEGGCPSSIVIKSYPGTTKILGNYKETHSHPINIPNMRFTGLSKETRSLIAEKVNQGISRKEIVKQIRGTALEAAEVGVLATSSRDLLVKTQEVARIERKLQYAHIRLDADDDASVIKYIEKLKAAGECVFLKGATDPSPAGSDLRVDAFILILQTQYQRQCWHHFGSNRLACIDGTHNTTQYKNATLFTLMVADNWGKGMPVAFMLASDGTEATISFFLRTVKAWNPSVIPKEMMSDHDRAQMNAIDRVFHCLVYLCRWHVLHAWQQHFRTDTYPELWDLLKKLVYADSEAKFNEIWAKICSLDTTKCPANMVPYLKKTWLEEKHMWAAYFRHDRTVFELAETNMLVEAWHHLLKSYFGEGVRNRRADHLLHTLSIECMTYFKARHQQQLAGLHGPNAEEKARSDTEKRALLIPAAAVIPVEGQTGVFSVQSQSESTRRYIVTIPTSHCTCRSFPQLNYCRHVSATRRLYPDACIGIPSPPTLLSTSKITFIPSTPPDDADISPASPTITDPLPSTMDQARKAHLISDVRRFLDAAESNPDALSQVDTSCLQGLQQQLTTLTNTFTQSSGPNNRGILPPTKEKIPARKSTDWKATAASMGGVKSGKKVIGMDVKKGIKRNIDPYSGGEQSGKKAKMDSDIPFDVSTFDISDLAALEKLILTQIKPLCKRYGISQTGKKDELIKRLHEHSHSISRAPETVTPGSSITPPAARPAAPSTSMMSTSAPGISSLNIPLVPNSMYSVPRTTYTYYQPPPPGPHHSLPFYSQYPTYYPPQYNFTTN